MAKNSTQYPQGIDEKTIFSILEDVRTPEPAQVFDVLEKAKEKSGLNARDVAVLLANPHKECREELLETARTIKREIYGSRLVLFAPLYITNECANRCTYCGFQAANTTLARRTLSTEELTQEVRYLENQGQKRLLLVYGEHPRFMRNPNLTETTDISGAEWIADTMQTVYDTVEKKSGAIRRVNVNCAPLSTEGFRLLKDVGIGTYQCFQETYHRSTYKAVHPKGPKSDYVWRYQAMHRAMEAGIDDVGMGVLFGLYNPAYDILALLQHAAQLEQEFGVGPHTISFPRMEPAQGADIASQPPYPVDDETFRTIIAVLRLAVPYTGLILSTRENAELRKELIEIGVSQISAASCTAPGGYTKQQSTNTQQNASQFTLGDHRSLDEVVHSVVADHNCLPSWCTACYRAGRTGEHFMKLAKNGFIQHFCHPNSLLTFKEYLLDYASEATRKDGEKLICQELQNLPAKQREKIAAMLCRIESGERDLFI